MALTKFFRRGKHKYIFLAAAPAGVGGPTVVELSAGIDVTKFISEISGFTFTASTIPVPTLDSPLTAQIEGEQTVENSTMTMYDEDDNAGIIVAAFRTALPPGATGVMVSCPYGATVVGKRVEQWPVRVIGVNDTVTVANEPAKTVISFAITGIPKLTQAIL